MSDFELNAENYYSKDADKNYMSVHQFLNFVGYLGIEGCEERSMAELEGKWEQETTDAMMVGSYVDAYFEGTLDRFKYQNPQIFTQKGELKAQYKRAEKMIAACERSDFFMNMMGYDVTRDDNKNIVSREEIGEHQKIVTGYMFGCDWKGKLDSYIPGVAIIDLKTSSNIHKAWNVRDFGKCSFVEYWGYTVQMAVYQKLIEIETGDRLPCYIAAVTKEDNPEIEVIAIDQMTLDHALNYVESNIASVLAVKDGTYEPTRCGHCDYCKSTKVLTEAISYQDLIYEE